MINNTLALYNQFRDETGDSVAASNLTLAHAMLTQQQTPAKQTLTVAEVARQLQCSEKTVHRLCRAGRLIHHRVGRCIRVAPEDVERYLAESRQDSGGLSDDDF